MTDSTTSPERQRGANLQAMAYYGLREVGEASDLDVSATKTTPWERPELAKWLNDPASYEALVWWRIDRAVRSMSDMSELVSWAKKTGKRLIFAEGPGGGPMELDLSGNSPVAELLTMVFAFAAQMEALAITERVSGAHAAIRSTELRWAGGHPPYGYKAMKQTDGPGWTLVPNEEELKILRDAVKMLDEDDMSLNAVCVRLNEQGRVPTKTKRSGKWHPGALRDILKSQALLGYKVTGVRNGQVPIRDENGRPIRSTDRPAMTPEEFAKIQEVLARKSKEPAPRSDTNSLAFGTLFCPGCGSKLYFNKGDLERGGKRASVYSCRVFGNGSKCPASSSVKAEWADEWITAEFLKRLGGAQTRETIYHPGSDPRPEIERTTEELETVAAQLAQARSDAERRVWDWRVQGLSKRLAELEAMPVTEAWTESVPTGRTIAEEWAEADTSQRRAMLLDAGVHVRVAPRETRGGRVVKEKTFKRFSMEIRAPEWAALEEALEAARDDAE